MQTRRTAVRPTGPAQIISSSVSGLTVRAMFFNLLTADGQSKVLRSTQARREALEPFCTEAHLRCTISMNLVSSCRTRVGSIFWGGGTGVMMSPSTEGVNLNLHNGQISSSPAAICSETGSAYVVATNRPRSDSPEGLGFSPLLFHRGATAGPITRVPPPALTGTLGQAVGRRSNNQDSIHKMAPDTR